MICPKCNLRMKCFTTFRIDNGTISKRWYRCTCGEKVCTTEIIDNGSLVLVDTNKIKVVNINE